MALLNGPIAHILLTNENDKTGAIRRHIGRRMEGGDLMQNIVEDAWRNRDRSPSTSTKSANVNSPDYTPAELYYGPKGVENASEDEVLKALQKAGI